MTTYAYDATRGRARPAPDDLHPAGAVCGEQHGLGDRGGPPPGGSSISPTGGHDSIGHFAIGADGLLTPVDWTPTGGATPRFFGLTPDGRFLVAANQDSDMLVPFRVDPATGALAATGQTIPSGSPACIVFAAW